MSDHYDSVMALLRLYQKWLGEATKAGESLKAGTYRGRIAALEGILKEVDDLRRITMPIPASYGDISDLPPELVKELTGVKVDELEQQIFTVVKSGADGVDLDAVLIELYRRFKVVQTRRYLQNKLWRMAQKELIFSVPSKKGVYSANKQDLDSSEKQASSDGPNNRATFDDLDDDVPF